LTTSDDASRSAQDNPAAGSAARDTTAITTLAKVLDSTRAYFEERSGAAAPQNQIYEVVTRDYLDAIDMAAPPSPKSLEAELLALLNTVIRDENEKIPKSDGRMLMARHLSHWQVAQVLLRLHHVIRIAPTQGSYDREYDLLAMYNAHGLNRGVYTTSEDDIRTVARRYNTQLSLGDFKEMLAILKEDAPRKHVCRNRDLIAVNNGIFFYGITDRDVTIDDRPHHFAAKSLNPFGPEFVFLAKCHVDYVEDAKNPVVRNMTDGTEWDVLTWIAELSDHEGIPTLLWEVIGAIIRPHVSWNKTAWFYAEAGNNGKGTICSLMRNLVGHDAHTSIPLSEMGKDFALEPLIKASAIIVDENDVGVFIDKAANLKTIVTNDVIQINRKYRMPVAFQFFGFMVQCLNGFPRVKDKSESFYRRQLFVPFDKSFTGAERRYIKDDYLNRPEVLEYVLWYVLHKAGAVAPGSYYELSEPPATKAVLAEYKEWNDPVRAYWEEFRLQFAWDLLPFPFLYDLFKVWFALVSPSGSTVSRQQFVADLCSIVRDDDQWYCEDKNKKIRPGQMMDDPEPLIAKFELKTWVSPTYKGSDPLQRSRPILAANYRGLRRRMTVPAAVPAGVVSSPTTDTDQGA